MVNVEGREKMAAQKKRVHCQACDRQKADELLLAKANRVHITVASSVPAFGHLFVEELLQTTAEVLHFLRPADKSPPPAVKENKWHETF